MKFYKTFKSILLPILFSPTVATAQDLCLDVDGSGTVNATDGVLILRRLNGGGTIDTGVVLPDGISNDYVVKAIDTRKNATLSIGITENTSPEANFTVSPSSGDTNTVFQFDASSSTDTEDALDVLQVRWDWENDGTWDTAYNTTKTVSHSFSSNGTYTIQAQVKDSGGMTSTTTHSVTIESISGDYTSYSSYIPSIIGSTFDIGNSDTKVLFFSVEITSYNNNTINALSKFSSYETVNTYIYSQNGYGAIKTVLTYQGYEETRLYDPMDLLLPSNLNVGDVTNFSTTRTRWFSSSPEDKTNISIDKVFEVVSKESLTVSAGTFDTIKIKIDVTRSDRENTESGFIWLAKGLAGVKYESFPVNINGTELLDFYIP